MNKIPTVESFLKEKLYITKDDTEDVHDSLLNVVEAVRILIGLHVGEALNEASEKADTRLEKAGYDEYRVVDKKTILNAYPLENIK